MFSTLPHSSDLQQVTGPMTWRYAIIFILIKVWGRRLVMEVNFIIFSILKVKTLPRTKIHIIYVTWLYSTLYFERITAPNRELVYRVALQYSCKRAFAVCSRRTWVLTSHEATSSVTFAATYVVLASAKTFHFVHLRRRDLDWITSYLTIS